MAEERVVIDIPRIPLEEQKKYKGMDVVLVDGKVVAAGFGSVEAYEKARALFPDRNSEDLLIMHIPREDVLIL